MSEPRHVFKGVKPPLSENHTENSIFGDESQTISNDMRKYGKMFILGYNGYFPQEDSRRKSTFDLLKRTCPNGVKPSTRSYVVKTPQFSKSLTKTTMHSAIYEVSKTERIINEYSEDKNTDMFQIGRFSYSPIDFVVDDIAPGSKVENPKASPTWISRYACRILIDREYPCTARVYAAGFDSSYNVFLGEEAIKWQDKSHMDGFTTNGVLIMHPKGTFCGGDAVSGHWKEVSVCGGVYLLRNHWEIDSEGNEDENVSNILKDGTLIDLSGATLLWRTSEGLTISPTKHQLQTFIDEMNAGRPQCPVGRNTLVIPQKRPYSSTNESNKIRQPYLYLNCGHVQGYHEWGQEKPGIRKCPLCMQSSPTAKLCVGTETAFYVDAGPPTYAFNPCGHMASEKTVKYWVNVRIPNLKHSFNAVCPFCVKPSKGYVKLILQDNLN